MKATRISAILCAAAFAASAQAAAQIAVHAGGNAGIGTSASIGMPGAAISTGGVMDITGGLNGPMGNANASGNANVGANASLTQNNAAANAALNAAIQNGATVQSVGGGTLTLDVAGSNGRTTLVLNMPSNLAASLGLQAGTSVAVTRTSSGIILTNLTYLHSIVGRAVVRSVNVARNTITFANNTGTHTIAVARGVISRLRLRSGSAIMIAARGATQVQLTTLASTQGPHR